MHIVTETLSYVEDGQRYQPTAWKFHSYLDTENLRLGDHRILVEVYDDPDGDLCNDDLYGDPAVERLAGQYIDFSILASFVDQVRANLYGQVL